MKSHKNNQSWLNVLCVVSYVVTILCTIYIVFCLFGKCSAGSLSMEKFIGFMVILLIFFLFILLSNNRKKPEDTDEHLETTTTK